MATTSRAVRIEPGSSLWPSELEAIELPPEALWVRGRVELLAHRPRIAIVGTRAPTPYGEAQSARFASALAVAGVSIVSGMARGIDQAAHGAALAVGGTTIAVLGSGVDRPWPPGALCDAVIERGLLLSEFQPGESPRPHHFPLRNRLISGLCSGVVVIEAAHASGSLITARWAADQGRTVYALPGRVDHPMARGAHRLIREGATLVESPEDVLADLGLRDLHTDREDPEASKRSLSKDGMRIIEALRGETLSADELAERTGCALTSVLVELVALEMEGAVVRGPGGLYRIATAGLRDR
jgi:DNA processing protein